MFKKHDKKKGTRARLSEFPNRIMAATGSIGKKLRRRFRSDRPLQSPSSSTGLVRRVKRFLRNSIKFVTPVESDAFVPTAIDSEKLGWKHFLNPILWFKWSTAFALNWLLSRPYSSFIAATPAAAVGALLLAVIILCSSDHSQTRASQYRSVFDDSIRSQDFEVASVVLKVLIDGSPENLELQYQQALLENLRGNTELAVEQMEALATLKNHGLAAMWLISRESNLQELKSWSKADHTRFRQLIEIGLSNLDGENLLSAKVLMFSYLAEIGAYSDAGRFLAEVVPARPELALAAATLCRSQLDSAGVTKYANIAERHFESVLSRQPSDIVARINLARVLMIQTRFEHAARLLNDGYRITKDERLTSVIGEALLVWSNHLGASDADSKNLVKRLQILRSALSIAPSNPLVGSAIAQLIIDFRDNRLPEVMQLKEAILSGTDPVSTHFIRGTLALLDDRIAEAKKELELALQGEPNVPAILNNLAVAIAEEQGGDLLHALSLVDIALSKFPDHAYFLETRGQILIKLNRWQEAILVLEQALDAEELRSAIYPSLALAYEKTGATELTQLYQQLANQTQRE